MLLLIREPPTWTSSSWLRRMVLAGREAFAPQDLPALRVTLDLVS